MHVCNPCDGKPKADGSLEFTGQLVWPNEWATGSLRDLVLKNNKNDKKTLEASVQICVSICLRMNSYTNIHYRHIDANDISEKKRKPWGQQDGSGKKDVC